MPEIDGNTSKQRTDKTCADTCYQLNSLQTPCQISQFEFFNKFFILKELNDGKTGNKEDNKQCETLTHCHRLLLNEITIAMSSIIQ